MLLIKNLPVGQLVQFVGLISQFTQGPRQDAQIFFTESLNFPSGHPLLQELLIKKFPEPQLVQVVALISQFTQGD